MLDGADILQEDMRVGTAGQPLDVELDCACFLVYLPYTHVHLSALLSDIVS